MWKLIYLVWFLGRGPIEDTTLIRLAGTSIKISAPRGLTESSEFLGWTSADGKVRLQILESYSKEDVTSLAQMEAEIRRTRGTVVDSAEDQVMDGLSARLIYYHDRASSNMALLLMDSGYAGAVIGFGGKEKEGVGEVLRSIKTVRFERLDLSRPLAGTGLAWEKGGSAYEYEHRVGRQFIFRDGQDRVFVEPLAEGEARNAASCFAEGVRNFGVESAKVVKTEALEGKEGREVKSEISGKVLGKAVRLYQRWVMGKKVGYVVRGMDWEDESGFTERLGKFAEGVREEEKK